MVDATVFATRGPVGRGLRGGLDPRARFVERLHVVSRAPHIMSGPRRRPRDRDENLVSSELHVLAVDDDPGRVEQYLYLHRLRQALVVAAPRQRQVLAQLPPERAQVHRLFGVLPGPRRGATQQRRQ